MTAVLAAVFMCCAACSEGARDGRYRVHIVATNDVHGHFFDSLYTGGGVQTSLARVSSYLKGMKDSCLVLIDVGDILQGDNAAYYFNYVDTARTHLFTEVAEYLGYDAAVPGNHDIETGHPVYDRVAAELGIPYLAANMFGEDDGKVYFDEYAVVRRCGLKIAVIGFTNPNVKGWLPEELWKGLSFKSIRSFAQEVVDRVRSRENPDIVIVAMHSGTGDGKDGSVENEGLACLESLEGVDFVFCAHDHSSKVVPCYRNVQGRDSLVSVLLNGGSHCREVAHAVADVTVRDGKVVSRRLSGTLENMSGIEPDAAYGERFRDEFRAVREFTLRPVGNLAGDIVTNEAFKGRAFYTDLLHAVQLYAGDADVSFAAPLTFDGRIPAGVIDFQGLFTIYPFENQLYIVNMTGREIKDALEYSYDGWIGREGSQGKVLRIARGKDKRSGAEKYHFVGRSYNFDSAAGLVYEVDVTAGKGNRVRISSLADGRPFCMDSLYRVAMTSYRASGGGGILAAAGVDTDRIMDRVTARYPQIRDILYDYVRDRGTVSVESVCSDPALGDWRFVPSSAEAKIAEDHRLVFGK